MAGLYCLYPTLRSSRRRRVEFCEKFFLRDYGAWPSFDKAQFKRINNIIMCDICFYTALMTGVLPDL